MKTNTIHKLALILSVLNFCGNFSVSTAQESQNQSLNLFLGEPGFITQTLWEDRGGTSLLTAKNGDVIAFQGRNEMIRVSKDGGVTWDPERSMQIGFGNGNAILDETNGDLLFMRPASDSTVVIGRSKDHGATWSKEDGTLSPDKFGLSVHSVGSMQAGITLMFGEYKGRLLMPGRIYGPVNSNDVEWRPFHYSTAMYSDDQGKTWHTSDPFPVFGTGEAALAEISDGSVMYNSREHMSLGNRYIAWSHNGGHTWLNPYMSTELYDGARGSSYGCMGGMLRLPVEGHDILIYSNLDTEAGRMPGEIGGSTTKERENISVWASFDGGKTWPLKRLVFKGPSAYSNLGVGRAGTASEGKIYLLYEGGPEGRNSAVQIAIFNLSWMLDGKTINEFIANN